VYRPEERAKWALRQIYYGEREFFSKNGRYSENVSDLGLKSQIVDGYVWPPRIQCTSTMYEAIIQTTDGTVRWHIRQDGKTWEQ
jgi:hypothetical protein